MKGPLEQAIEWADYSQLEKNVIVGADGDILISEHFDMSLQWLPKIAEPLTELHLKRLACNIFRN